METTFEIDDELMAFLRDRANAEKVSVSQMVNRLLRRFLPNDTTQPAEPIKQPYREEPLPLGKPKFNWDKALAFADALNDEAMLEKMAGHGENR